ncbi:hypothetical protein Bbelb_115640 [Branchiostoma belcheri]|nr:hypothetical protein Bbelb_115640 [Branchiostoma belcheri]
MYEQAEPVCIRLAESGNGQTGGVPGSSKGAGHGNDDVSNENREVPEAYEDAEAVKLQVPRLRQAKRAEAKSPLDGTGPETTRRLANTRYTTDTSEGDRTYHNEASERLRAIRTFIRTHWRFCMSAAFVVVSILAIVGLAQTMFNHKAEMTTDVDALKRELDGQWNRSAELEQRLHEISKGHLDLREKKDPWGRMEKKDPWGRLESLDHLGLLDRPDRVVPPVRPDHEVPLVRPDHEIPPGRPDYGHKVLHGSQPAGDAHALTGVNTLVVVDRILTVQYKMYEQAEPVCIRLAESGNGQTGGPPSEPTTDHHEGSNKGAGLGNDDVSHENREETSPTTYEDAEAVKLQGARLRQAKRAEAKSPLDGTGPETTRRLDNSRYTTDTSAADRTYHNEASERLRSIRTFIRTHWRFCMSAAFVVVSTLAIVGLAQTMINHKAEMTTAVDALKRELDGQWDRSGHLDLREKKDPWGHLEKKDPWGRLVLMEWMVRRESLGYPGLLGRPDHEVPKGRPDHEVPKGQPNQKRLDGAPEHYYKHDRKFLTCAAAGFDLY